MKKLLKDFRSENGASSVLEATIVFPLVFLIVVFLIFLGFTYGQKAYLQYHADHLSQYISKTILYLGYQHIDKPFYSSNGNSDEITLNDVKNAMNSSDPYRYFMGLFKTSYKPKDANDKNIVEEASNDMVENYLVSHGFLKPSKDGSLSKPASDNFANATVSNKNGFICAISADTSKVSVYIAQDYMFAKFFGMIGMGGKYMAISGTGTTFITDSIEFIRNTDMVFDAANFLAEKLGIDTEKIKDVISKITGNNNK